MASKNDLRPADPPSVAEPSHGQPKDSSLQSVSDNRLMVLAILFLGTGALGLPLLWISHTFSRPAKIILSIVVVAYTLSLLLVIGWIINWGWQMMTNID